MSAVSNGIGRRLNHRLRLKLMRLLASEARTEMTGIGEVLDAAGGAGPSRTADQLQARYFSRKVGRRRD